MKLSKNIAFVGREEYNRYVFDNYEVDNGIYYSKPSGGKWNLGIEYKFFVPKDAVFKLGDVWAIPKDSDKPNANRTREARKNIEKDKICHP